MRTSSFGPLAVAVLALLLAAGPAAAQLFGPPPPKVGPGAGKSPAEVICADPSLSQFCSLVKAARNDPLVQELYDPTFVGTIFAPLDEGIQDDAKKIASKLGVGSFSDLTRRPELAARVVANQVIVGQALQFNQLKNDQKYQNELGQTLEIDTGLLGGAGSLLGGLYIKGPVNTVRLRASQGFNNIPAGRAYIHKATGILIPK